MASLYDDAMGKLQHCVSLLDATVHTQDGIVRSMLGAILHHIVGEEAAAMYRKELLDYLGVGHVARKMMFILPRQSGKTTAMGTVLGLFLLCCPGKYAVCYGSSEFSAKLLKDRAKAIFNQMAGDKIVVVVDNEHQFHVRHPDGSVTKIQCNSPCIEMNPDIIFFDDFEYSDVLFYKAVAAPLINKRGRSFLSTSTPGETPSPMVELRKKWAQSEYGVIDYTTPRAVNP